MRLTPIKSIGLTVTAFLATSPALCDKPEDLYFGEAVYYANQGFYFEALERLDAEFAQHHEVDEPNLDSLFPHIADAQFSLGDFELRYRMHHRAGRAISAVLEGAVDEMVRNDAAYRLARIQFQKGQMTDAMHSLERIDGRVPAAIEDDIEFLRANIHLAEGRPAAAIAPLENLQHSKQFAAFAAYNLGIAFLQNGSKQEAIAQLDRAGQVSASDPGELAIRDKSNLVLGTLFLEQGEFAEAATHLDRVRLDGPYSNQALLSSGWANVSAERLERAIVPWGILAEREVTDRATQEAMLSLPFAYGRLERHGRAAMLYGDALAAFDGEIDKLNASIESIREGRFLAALSREEIRKDKDWVIRLRSLPETPETYYMMELLASHDFQTGLQNYLDLADLRRKLHTWRTNFDAFEDMIAIRRRHYEPLLPDVDASFRELDSRIRLRREQHNMLVKRRDDLLTTPRPSLLATRDEQLVLARIEDLEAGLADAESPLADELLRRCQRLRGLLTWTLETEYHERLTAFDTNLRRLDEAMTVAQAQYDQYIRARQAATHSYVGYDRSVQRMRARTNDSIATLDRLIIRQGRLLEIVAIDELVARRSRLENYGDKARFALADSYDRATQAQARRENP
ncbi:MAG: tetratricopeptide repeat protein [Chromatiales bacterium]|nr:tetratricopeptide repeat protein [Chromatiales bacterium]